MYNFKSHWEKIYVLKFNKYLFEYYQLNIY